MNPQLMIGADTRFLDSPLVSNLVRAVVREFLCLTGLSEREDLGRDPQMLKDKEN
jgi:hypothetical protein